MIKIENFDNKYTDDLFSISLATGHLGGDASHLYDDPKLIGLIYSTPYATLEPSMVLLVTDDQGVAGFALGVTDTSLWEDRLERDWWPRLRAEYPDPSYLPSSEWTHDQRRFHMIHHPSRIPTAILGSYPAHLHMNLRPRAQGAGVGMRLLNAWLDLIAPYAPSGVHVGANRHNERAVNFWKRAGFRELEIEPMQLSRTILLGREFSASEPALSGNS
ncbi:GNAT family N-acetyltransferase [Agrobacterium vitis]|uniref:GNAT family N-acetyltransferase n=1 Tax=Agrobacterium vitis TaxID=373 RepID=A0AAE2RER2_AGRVI|nr:GNAT family N-acetyltransferase [Agrobacterium vitis]MBF2716908.1 GNAT family N-acetyltransferase [Agrobacterium vitis]MUZ64111.1 GNAT family N-acetyltransferase [Agrobacterium vitis]